MSTVIRMQRSGGRNHPVYRVVVTDSRRARDGRFIEKIGYYNPRSNPILLELDQERVEHWLNHGAQPSESVAALLKRVQKGTVAELVAPPKPKAAPVPKKAEVAAADTADAAPADAAPAEASGDGAPGDAPKEGEISG